MKVYKIYFEFYGKKMKTKIQARDENDAKEILLKKIKFHKIEAETELDFLKKIFGL